MAQRKIALKGVVPAPADGLRQFQEANGTLTPYPVAPVADSPTYETRAGKQGVTHITDKKEKHCWPLSILSREASNGKVQFLNGTKPASVGDNFTTIAVPERMGRDMQGAMLT